MSQPPHDSIFMSHSACNVTAEDGNFSAIMGCNILDLESREASCVGGLYGETGAYEGRRGLFSKADLRSAHRLIIGAIRTGFLFRRIFSRRKLQFRQPCIEPAAGEQFAMRSLIDDFALVHDNNAVGFEDSRQAVCDDD